VVSIKGTQIAAQNRQGYLVVKGGERDESWEANREGKVQANYRGRKKGE